MIRINDKRSNLTDKGIMRRGNCYYATEALYYILGGHRQKAWKPKVMRHNGDTHWFLKHRSGIILDPSRKQFKKLPDYTKAKGCGFMTSKPSHGATNLILKLTWQNPWSSKT